MPINANAVVISQIKSTTPGCSAVDIANDSAAKMIQIIPRLALFVLVIIKRGVFDYYETVIGK